MKNKRYLFLLIQGVILFLFSSCSDVKSLEVDYSFESAINVEQSIHDFHKVKFSFNESLDLGFYKGDVWIKLEVSNGQHPASYVVLCGDLINRNYRFYKLNKTTNQLIPQEEVNLEKYDHRTFNYAKPNFQINLNSNEESTFFITTSSDGRILQASPRLISLDEFQSIRQQTLIFDIVFYGVIAIILLINLIYFRMVRSKIYYFYAAYILSSCLMYLFVEGRLYGLGISHSSVDHLMFVSIRIWILTGILFTTNFLETKITNPRFYRFILVLLFLTLGVTSIYQFALTSFSISTLHKTENIIGFMWIVLSLTIVGIAYRKRKIESIYYIISYTLLLVFITLGLIDSHMTILPGDPFSYFKIGTVFELIGFTYFIFLIIEKKLNKTEDLENELLENRKQLLTASEEIEEKNKRLSAKKGIEKTDLISVFKLVENSLSKDADWDEFKVNFNDLNPNFLDRLLVDHSDLSKSEIRLLTLIKIGYSQKEIANILSIAPDSVKKAKGRVRKKLNLTEVIQLNDYLLKF